MLDSMTKQPLHIFNPDSAYPRIWLPVSQVDAVRQLLDQHGIRYTVDEHQIAFNGEPPTTRINLARGTNSTTVQAVLDSAP